MSKSNPLNAGANRERTAIIAKVRRMMRDTPPNSYGSKLIPADYLLRWLLGRNERCDRKRGGVGK
jgi:hypothetical protein